MKRFIQVYWQHGLIDYATKNNFQMFDFLGAGSPNKNYGVREFKSKFGGELLNHGRFIRINKKYLYKIEYLIYSRKFLSLRHEFSVKSNGI